jgi:hypothetical protein
VVPVKLRRPDVPDDPLVPDDPDVPDEPDDPELPDEPVDPELPDEPVEPELPDVPDDPELPDEPVDPELPDEPVDPELPDEPVEPELPEDPLVPEEPEEPEVPEEPPPPVSPLSPVLKKFIERFCPLVGSVPLMLETGIVQYVVLFTGVPVTKNWLTSVPELLLSSNTKLPLFALVPNPHCAKMLAMLVPFTSFVFR